MIVNLLALVGAIVLLAAVIGHIVPGMNFHVIFAPDAETVEGHIAMAERVIKRMEEKQ